MQKPKVIILGGGVAGMSAAHELVERNFEVEVYEREAYYVGGKARSVDVPDSAVDGRHPLPGEHGFRFFPGFYKHVTDTMKRIPVNGGSSTAYDNLVATDRITIAREAEDVIITLANFPKSVADLKVMLASVKDHHIGLTKEDIEMMASSIWQLMTSCYERRLNDYERLAWWDYTNAEEHSAAYNEFFVSGLTRTLVAAKARQVSTRTGGDILLQLIFQMADPFKKVDRVLNAPTNDAWLHPWYKYLTGKGVKFFHGHEAIAIDCEMDKQALKYKITGAKVRNEEGDVRTVQGDYYISAVPVERMSELINDQLLKGEPRLAGLKELAKDVAWMTGIQFYLNTDVPIARGHVIIEDSPWAVTAISQAQFWPDVDLEEYGNGKVRGVLSVDVSDWDKIGYCGKCAMECDIEEVMQEVWCQLVLGLRVDGKPLLNKDMVVACYLDRDIAYKPGEHVPPSARRLDVSKLYDCAPGDANQHTHQRVDKSILGDQSNYKTINKEPLLVNRVMTWDLRPEAFCRIPNLFLAADYVRTYTDLATMEGANEAARRAVNSIISTSGYGGRKCKLWKLHEPFIFWPYRYHDKRRFARGMQWKQKYPWWIHLFAVIVRFITKVASLFTSKR